MIWDLKIKSFYIVFILLLYCFVALEELYIFGFGSVKIGRSGRTQNSAGARAPFRHFREFAAERVIRSSWTRGL